MPLDIVFITCENSRTFYFIVVHQKIRDCLNELEQNITPLTTSGEHEIALAIKNTTKSINNYQPTEEDIAEQIAFDFMADYRNTDSGWGTYYGPMMVFRTEKGNFTEYPSITSVTPAMLKYWTQRATASVNPILSSRYADIVLDFSQIVLQEKKFHIELARIVIDSTITICSQSLAPALQRITKIHRALDLACRINDQTRIKNVVKTIIDLGTTVAEDDKPRLWGFAFKWLILDSNTRVTLTEKERQHLLTDLEERLTRVGNKPYAAEKAVSLLAEYYAKKRDESNLLRVLSALEISFKSDLAENSDPLLIINRYQRMQEIYQAYAAQGFRSANTEKERLVQEMGQLKLDWKKAMKKFSTAIPISNEELNNYVAAFFSEDDKLETVLTKIGLRQFSRKEAIKTQLDNISNEHPISFRIEGHVISDDGIPLARLRSITQDYDKHFKQYAALDLQLGGPFLVFTTDELKRRFQKEAIIEYFRRAVLFEKEENGYLERALSAYWEGDYIVASHLFIPMIESAVRELVKGANGQWSIVNKIGGYDRVPLTTLLYDDVFIEIMQRVFAPVGDDVLFYLRLVLTEKLGMNLRNDFAHGVGKKKFFEQSTSNRLFHILILLSLIAVK